MRPHDLDCPPRSLVALAARARVLALTHSPRIPALVTQAAFAIALARAALAAAMLFLSSCAVLSPPPPREGGSSLSTAATEAAKKDDDKQKTLVAGRREHGHDHGTVVVVDAGERCDVPEREVEYAPPPEPPHAPGPRRMHVAFVTGASSVPGSAFHDFGLAGIQVGGRPSPHVELDAALLGASMAFNTTSGLVGAFDHPFEIAGDFSARFPLSADDEGPSLYPIVGFRAGSLLWDYHTPLTVSDQGDLRRVDSDWVNYYAPYAGIGATLARTGRFQLGMNVTGGARLWDNHSYEGFRNDTFHDAGFVQVMLEAGVRF